MIFHEPLDAILCVLRDDPDRYTAMEIRDCASILMRPGLECSPRAVNAAVLKYGERGRLKSIPRDHPRSRTGKSSYSAPTYHLKHIEWFGRDDAAAGFRRLGYKARVIDNTDKFITFLDDATVVVIEHP